MEKPGDPSLPRWGLSRDTDDEYSYLARFDEQNSLPVTNLCSNPSYGDDEVYI
jgi:hypothetical protein